MWLAGHDWGKVSCVVHSFLVAHGVLFDDDAREAIALCRRELTHARGARGPIRGFDRRLVLNAHEASQNTLNALYSVVRGAACLPVDDTTDTRLAKAAKGIRPLMWPFQPKRVTWLQHCFVSRRDDICRFVLRSFPQLDTHSLAVEIEWEAMQAYTSIAEPQGTPLGIDFQDERILQALADDTPRLLTQDEIEAESRIPRRTISARMNSLLIHRLVIQPKGPKSGTTITEDGKKLLKKLHELARAKLAR
jgi:hypothetical protein